MAGAIGPNKYLPGQRLRVQDKIKCDDHPERLAVTSVVGETDSFGSEIHYKCQECLDKYKNAIAQEEEGPSWCDHCNAMVNEKTKPIRDPDEGSCGPVYYVCEAGRKQLFNYHRDK